MQTEDLYPKVRISLKEDIDAQFNALWENSLKGIAEEFIGPENNNLLDGLKSGFSDGINNYADGIIERCGQRSEKEDNYALEKIANLSRGLNDALGDLLNFPGVENRLETEIRNCAALYEKSDGQTLKDLIGTRYNIFQELGEILTDLEVCAEDVINRRPEERDPDYEEADRALGIEETHDDRMRLWRQRSKDRKFDKDHALQRFLIAFRPYWEAAFEVPFTEGMHYSEIGGTQSELVHLLEQVFAHVDGAVTHSGIVSSLRKVRQMKAKEIPS